MYIQSQMIPLNCLLQFHTGRVVSRHRSAKVKYFLPISRLVGTSMLYHSSFFFDMMSHVAQAGPKFSMQVPIRLYTQVMKRTTCRQVFHSTMRVLKLKLRSSAWRKVSLPTEASHWFLMSSLRDWISDMRMACCNVRLPFMVGLFHECPLAFYFPSCYNLSRAFTKCSFPVWDFQFPEP